MVWPHFTDFKENKVYTNLWESFKTIYIPLKCLNIFLKPRIHLGKATKPFPLTNWIKQTYQITNNKLVKICLFIKNYIIKTQLLDHDFVYGEVRVNGKVKPASSNCQILQSKHISSLIKKTYLFYIYEIFKKHITIKPKTKNKCQMELGAWPINIFAILDSNLLIRRVLCYNGESDNEDMEKNKDFWPNELFNQGFVHKEQDLEWLCSSWGC